MMMTYCNSLLFGISDGLLRRLQSVQNAAARLVTGTRRCDHITPVLRQSVSALCSRSRGSCISSLSDWLPRTSQTTVAFCRTLAVAHCGPIPMRKLLVPRTHNKLGDRSLSAAGPRLWNDLPPGLRRPGLTFDSFRQSLKTHLFGDRSA